MYGGFHALKQQLHQQTYKNHLKYGAFSWKFINIFNLVTLSIGLVVRLGPERFVFNSVTALRVKLGASTPAFLMDYGRRATHCPVCA
jgi:hypothetical protein